MQFLIITKQSSPPPPEMTVPPCSERRGLWSGRWLGVIDGRSDLGYRSPERPVSSTKRPGHCIRPLSPMP